ncbi:RCC1 and BTB domain-containing protein 1 [Camponotus floridanus]|uniref:RCC1 and BTB domain-containing protein 1 n=1 Tax=Camponotus floridanus TaxID=104421 RepID=E2A4G6_CAMFO|nr:RCC1 and BTB domain-containing protein 1 [Camponotus floridanus]
MSSSSKKFCSPEDIEKRNAETTINEKKEMQKYKKRILQCILAEKIMSMELKHWPFFHMLKPEFIRQIHMVMVYFWVFDKHEITKKWPIMSTPIRVSGFNKKRIVDIACGKHHFLVLTSDGEVYAWRNGNYMLDGNKNTAIFTGRVRQVKHELDKKNVVHIACGEKFNMVITDENKLYVWGSNKYGQISTIQSQKQYVYPCEITTFSDKIDKVVCGYAHTLALTNKGEIYAWGGNSCGQVGRNNKIKSSDPIVVNVRQMGKVLNVDAYGNMSVAVGYDRTIYVWGNYFDQKITQPFPTKFLRICDVFTHTMSIRMHKPLIVHDSVHTEGITNNYNYKYTEEILNILESLGAAFDDPLTSDLTIQVERQPIYVHQVILIIRCQYFRNMFYHDCTEDVQSTSDSSPVYIVSDKFSYIVYKAFLKYLYTGTIDLLSENSLELMELAELYCETDLKKDCSRIIKQTITVSNVAFLYNKAIEYNAKELEKYCFQFALRHMTANILSEDYLKLDMSTEIVHRELIQNDVTITSSTLLSPNKNVKKRNSQTTIKKNKMQKFEKRILQCVLVEKIIPIDLKYWLFFHMLNVGFIAQIHMVMVYDNSGNAVIIVMKDKNVYNLHYKKKHLKTGDTPTALKKIKELCGKNIKIFADRCNSILALTEEGEVYYCEKVKNPNSNEILYLSTFIRVAELSDKRIVDIACRELYILALTSDGEVYTWGNYWEKNDSQIGNENTAFNVPRQMKHKLEKKKVVHIACGLFFNIVVTDENTIYGWGYNGRNQISNVRSQTYYKHPHEIITISDEIVKVACGDSHTLALTCKGEVYAWGDNSRGQVGVNSNRKSSGPTVVNVPDMGKILDIAAYHFFSVAVGTDRIIYVWGEFYCNSYFTNKKRSCINIPFPTKFSNIHDVSVHSLQTSMFKPFIVLTNNFNNFNVKEILNILESLRAVFNDPCTSDLTIRVEERPIYVHKAILMIRCQYFKNMFQHDWIENIQSISDSVYTVSDKFSYVVYKAFLKYLYTGIIDLPAENALELMELADMYCETNLIKDCSQIIKKIITVSNVAFFYNKAIECNAKELEKFCLHFALRHMKAVILSEEYIKLDMNTKYNFIRRAAEEAAEEDIFKR